jgi:hydroxymethylpyrimidine pyrophosphatase-like HAD family hydrolase
MSQVSLKSVRLKRGARVQLSTLYCMDAVKGGKFEALEYVRTLFGVPRERCVAAGDSGNDILMLEGLAFSIEACTTAL